MTEFWKSNAMHWCDVCKCWMNDNKATRLNHERASKHQENLQKKLRDMARNADNAKREAEQTASALDKIEAAARKRYEQDKKEAASAMGTWTWEEDSKYYYNPVYRWYYDPNSKWYYGGEPAPQWTEAPKGLPDGAYFGVAPHEGGPVPLGALGHGPTARSSSGAGASTSGAGGPSSNSGTAAGAFKTVQRVIAVPSHPLANVGGHQAPLSGKVGGAMGAGMVIAGSDAAGAGDKRKRDGSGPAAAGNGKDASGKKGGGGGKPVDPEEAAAQARREAARARVAARTAGTFGYQ